MYQYHVSANVPIVAHYELVLADEQREEVARIADQLGREWPELSDGWWRPYVAPSLPPGPALHLDDLSDIQLLNPSLDLSYLEDRALLRAMDGDFVASCGLCDSDFQVYCRDQLQLGSPTWLQVAPTDSRIHVAEACWQDRAVRRAMVHAVRAGNLQYLHPHMGTQAVWRLAELLHGSSRRPIHVVAPPPDLTRIANDKLSFAKIVRQLLGESWIPRTEQAANLAWLSERIREIAESSRLIGIKLPSSIGGGGNIVVRAERFRGMTLAGIREELRLLLPEFTWHGDMLLLVDEWESDVLAAPSVQTWIPPVADGSPWIEGVFLQSLGNDVGSFVGCRPAELPSDLEKQIVWQCFRLVCLFQQLGYIGRCSFDLLLTGKNWDSVAIKFVECNGRWGGTSLPMTLMNRLLGDWRRRRFLTQEISLAELRNCTFRHIQQAFQDRLFDIRSGQGDLIFFNPAKLRKGGINLLVMIDDFDSADDLIRTEIVPRLKAAAGR